MNSQLILIVNTNAPGECDRCGDTINAGDVHYHTENDEIILCNTCAHLTKE